MNVESTLGIIASIIAIGTLAYEGFQKFKRKDLSTLMTELSDPHTSIKSQRNILRKINVNLRANGKGLSTDYIASFKSDGRAKSVIFHDMCLTNDIEPTADLCKRVLGYDEPSFRKEWHRKNSSSSATKSNAPMPNDNEGSKQFVYISELLFQQYPTIYKSLTTILNMHNIPHGLLKGTRDIWCRDYMPVQTPSGKLIQFKYDPSYLRDERYSGIRSDVKDVDALNNITPIFSDINLDGGNVVMYGTKAIITDRVFSENPDWTKESLKAELARLLECEIIIIPAYKPDYDFTGHADGMIRFVDSNTVLVNDLEKDFVYMKNGIIKALDKANLSHINFPFFDYKIKGNTDHAIGIYLNYLEVDGLIIMPVFGVPGNLDVEALTKLKEVFPNKIIETINYNDIALKGGLLNCTTWIIQK